MRGLCVDGMAQTSRMHLGSTRGPGELMPGQLGGANGGGKIGGGVL